jgi:hypothetical protein
VCEIGKSLFKETVAPKCGAKIRFSCQTMAVKKFLIVVVCTAEFTMETTFFQFDFFEQF